MRGLILQDVLAMKKVMRTYGLVAFVYVIFGMMSQKMSQFGAFFIFFSVFVPMSAFAFREKNKWDLNAAIMPVSRRCMVKATYFMSFGVLAFGVFCVFILNLIDIFTQKIDANGVKNLLAETGILAFGGIVYMSFMLPVLFKYGVEKGRIILMAAYLIPFALIMFGAKSGIDMGAIFTFVQEKKNVLAGVLLLVAVLIIAFSYVMSLRIYKKKEF